MSEFSRALEEYIYKSGLTENQLAKISGFTRSYIALMKNGQRVSPDTAKLKKLLEALSLSPYEYDGLWSAYLKARYGEQTYELQKDVISFIESFGRMSKISIKSDFHHEIPDVTTLNNRMDLEIFVKAVIEEEALCPDGRICLILQENFPFLLNLLPSVCRSNPGLKVEHMICFEGNEGSEGSDMGYNLKILGAVMPIILSGQDNRYEVYYYYDKITSHFSNFVLMPYMIMTSRYVINISTDLEYALISRSPEAHQLYESLFTQRKKICRRLFLRIPTGMHVFEFYARNRPVSDVTYTIGSQPCFGVFPVDTLVKNYIIPQDNDLMSIVLGVLEDNRRHYASMSAMASYFTKDGIRRLMEEGIVDELPREMYTPLHPGDRKILLKMLIGAIKNGTYEAYLLDDEKFTYPRELVISAYSITSVHIVYLAETLEARFVLQEQSTSRIIFKFLSALKMSTQVYNRDETVAYLEKICERY